MSFGGSCKKKIKTVPVKEQEETINNNRNNNDEHEERLVVERIQKYLHDCPHVPRGHPLLQAAIRAVDQEHARQQRDRKLQSKFSAKTLTSTSTATTTTGGRAGTASAVDPMEDGLVVVENHPGSPLPPPTAEEEMEWQDVPNKDKEEESGEEEHATSSSSSSTRSFLGKVLAKAAIDKISEHQQKVMSPVAAIALALHAGLRSETLGFACTGIPETETIGGFAPPVRELPPHQFLPTSWDSSSTNLALRYRKAGTGALVLRVQLHEDADKIISVRFQPASTKEPSPQMIEFPLEEHVNLDSWNVAVKTTPYVSPALHYKSLALLMTKFCQTFDLGTVQEDADTPPACATKSIPYFDNTTVHTQRSEFIPSRPGPSAMEGYHRMPDGAGRVPSTFGEAFPGIFPQRVGGDFSQDASPAGVLIPPFFLPPDGRGMGGNLMGPNHPLFQGGPTGGLRGGIPLGGPGSMQPRYDPIYPDVIDVPGGGGPAPPTNRFHRPRPSGDPNPDHLPPPNAFGGNMFA